VASAYRDRTESYLATLAEPARTAAALLVEAGRVAGWPVVIQHLGARRTLAEQAALVERGLSKAPNSRHLAGLAFDLDLAGYPREAGMELWRHYGRWIRQQGGTWGGDFGDYGHFEFRR
jgi:hypothetical protein